jgi:hypothetical protein
MADTAFSIKFSKLLSNSIFTQAKIGSPDFVPFSVYPQQLLDNFPHSLAPIPTSLPFTERFKC